MALSAAAALTALSPLPDGAPQGAPPAQAEPPAPSAEDGVVVVGRSRRGDPLVSVNATAYGAAQSVDKAFVGPAARAYRTSLPGPLRSGLRNFLANLREPVVAANYLLQLKIGKAAETVGRFAINTTVGVLGVVDMAKRKPFRLPRRRNSFANTLGFYGVKPGPFFFLPLVGATTLRDLLGNVGDQLLVPIGPVQPLRGRAYTMPVGVLSALDHRAEFDDEIEAFRSTVDPYAAQRGYYLARRQLEIDRLRGVTRKHVRARAIVIGDEPIRVAEPPLALVPLHDS